MGNLQSQSIKKAEMIKEDLFKQVDMIAAHYIVSLNMKDLKSLMNDEYCKNVEIIVKDALLKHVRSIDVLNDRVRNGYRADIADIVVIKHNEKLTDNELVEKQNLCKSVAQFYTRIAHVYAAIARTINPLYKSKGKEYNIFDIYNLNSNANEVENSEPSDISFEEKNKSIKNRNRIAKMNGFCDQRLKMLMELLPQQMVGGDISNNPVDTNDKSKAEQDDLQNDLQNDLQDESARTKVPQDDNTVPMSNEKSMSTDDIESKPLEEVSDNELFKPVQEEIKSESRNSERKKHSSMPKVCESQGSVYDQVGFKTLEDLFNDTYDVSLNKYVMSDKMKKEYDTTLEKFYIAFTGNNRMPRTGDDAIKSFHDIKLKNYNNTMSCQDINSDDTDVNGQLFTNFAKHIQTMMQNTNEKYKNLTKYLGMMFSIFEDKSKGISYPMIKSSLNSTTLKSLIPKVRNEIVDLYIDCEKDFQKGMRIHDAIKASLVLSVHSDRQKSLEEAIQSTDV